MAKDTFRGMTPFKGPELVNTGLKENIISNGDYFMVKSLGKYLNSVTNHLPPGGTWQIFNAAAYTG